MCGLANGKKGADGGGVMASETSVSQWILGVQQGDPVATQRLWEHYYGRLVRLASRKLGSAPRRVRDEEDVAASALTAFCLAAKENRFPDVGDREGLWRRLVTLTARKVASQHRYTMRQKRGGGRVRGESALKNEAEDDSVRGLDQVIGDLPTPEFAAIFREELERLLKGLDEDCRQVVVAKLEGRTNPEIAARLGCSLASVERRVRLIRKAWERELET